MRPGNLAVLIFLCLYSTAAGASPAGEASPEGPLARFTPEQRERLRAGDPVFEYTKTSKPGQVDQGFGQAYILINAPVAACFEIFSELDKQYQYFPRKTKSKVIKKEASLVLLENEFDFYLATIYYTARYTIIPEKHRFEFEMDKDFPHNIRESAGYFVFEKVDEERTLFTYAATRLDTGVRVPAFIQEYITSRDLPAQAANVKKRIESKGRWTDK